MLFIFLYTVVFIYAYLLKADDAIVNGYVSDRPKFKQIEMSLY